MDRYAATWGGGGGWRSMSVKAGMEKRCFQNQAGTFPLFYKVVVSPLSHYTKSKIRALY